MLSLLLSSTHNDTALVSRGTRLQRHYNQIKFHVCCLLFRDLTAAGYIFKTIFCVKQVIKQFTLFLKLIYFPLALTIEITSLKQVSAVHNGGKKILLRKEKKMILFLKITFKPKK